MIQGPQVDCEERQPHFDDSVLEDGEGIGHRQTLHESQSGHVRSQVGSDDEAQEVADDAEDSDAESDCPDGINCRVELRVLLTGHFRQTRLNLKCRDVTKRLLISQIKLTTTVEFIFWQPFCVGEKAE